MALQGVEIAPNERRDALARKKTASKSLPKSLAPGIFGSKGAS